MPARDLWCWLTVLGWAALAFPAAAQNDEASGLAAIWSEYQGESVSFQGTAFHIGDGVFVTAAHVLHNAGEEWHAVIGSFKGEANRINHISTLGCDENRDICFFRVDPNSALLIDSAPFKPTCLLPPTGQDQSELYMRSFAPESETVKLFNDIQIRSTTGQVLRDDGSVFTDALLADAGTSGGTSGSPVFDPQTREVIGVHIGFSEDSRDQIISPFFAIDSPAEIGGVIVFEPETCAQPNRGDGPRVVAEILTRITGHECLELTLSNLPRDFALASVLMTVTDIAGPDQISPGNNAGSIYQETFNFEIAPELMFQRLPFILSFPVRIEANKQGDTAFLDICPINAQTGQRLLLHFSPDLVFLGLDRSELTGMTIVDSEGNSLSHPMMIEVLRPTDLDVALDEGVSLRWATD